MRRLFGLLFILHSALCLSSPAAILYVDLNSPGPIAPFTTWATAATNIQDAIDAASPGDTVLVTNGVYSTGGRVIAPNLITNRVAVVKPISIQSVNGPEVTIIQGYQIPDTTNGDAAVRCAFLTNGASLSGFTLTNGATRTNSGSSAGADFQGGGSYCASTNSILSNCNITGCSSSFSGNGASGATLINCSLLGNQGAGDGWHANQGYQVYQSVLANCTIVGNGGVGGVEYGTLYQCMIASNGGSGAEYSTLYNCTLRDNTSAGAADSTLYSCAVIGNQAGGIYRGSAYNCIISNNYRTGQTQSGGGAFRASLVNCLLVSNWAAGGGSADHCFLGNCTVTGNLSAVGGAIYYCTNFNSLVFGNYGPSSTTANFTGGSFNNCCTSPLPDSGVGNISVDPQLNDLYHLLPNSVCRGAGNPAYVSGGDLDGKSWSNPPSMGCFEYSGNGPLSVSISAPASNVASGYSIKLTGHIFGNTTGYRWDFGDGSSDTTQLSQTHQWPGLGNYVVTLTASNLDNPAGVSSCLLIHVVNQPTYYVAQGNPNPAAPYTNWASAATNIQDAIDSTETIGAQILVSNGVYSFGGRATPDPLAVVSSNFAYQSNRVYVDKSVTVASVNGPDATLIVGYRLPTGPFVYANGLGNGAVRGVWLGNGATLDGFTVTNGGTTVSASTNACSGGGVFGENSNSCVINCTIISNAAYVYGGGVYGGTISRSRIEFNIANTVPNGRGSTGGGGAGNARLVDCFIYRNDGGTYGGGAISSSLYNCNVISNRYAGVDWCSVYNFIVYSNLYGDFSWQAVFFNSFISSSWSGGYGTITNDPLFVDPANGDFHLQFNSPCINAGNNAYAIGSTDLDGNPRISGGTVDMGAYEFQNPASSLSYAWLQHYGLPNDGSADTIDSDHDGLNNYQEWRTGTDPTNAASVLQLLSPTNSGTNLVVTWQSVTNINYYLQRTLGLAPANFQTIAFNIPGFTNSTSYTDTNAPPPGPWFYRIGVQ